MHVVHTLTTKVLWGKVEGVRRGQVDGPCAFDFLLPAKGFLESGHLTPFLRFGSPNPDETYKLLAWPGSPNTHPTLSSYLLRAWPPPHVVLVIFHEKS